MGKRTRSGRVPARGSRGARIFQLFAKRGEPCAVGDEFPDGPDEPLTPWWFRAGVVALVLVGLVVTRRHLASAFLGPRVLSALEVAQLRSPTELDRSLVTVTGGFDGGSPMHWVRSSYHGTPQPVRQSVESHIRVFHVAHRRLLVEVPGPAPAEPPLRPSRPESRPVTGYLRHLPPETAEFLAKSESEGKSKELARIYLPILLDVSNSTATIWFGFAVAMALFGWLAPGVVRELRPAGRSADPGGGAPVAPEVTALILEVAKGRTRATPLPPPAPPLEADERTLRTEGLAIQLENARCPYCSEPVSTGRTVLCAECRTPHHAECWAQNGDRCTIFGCGSGGRRDD